jgi:hypothetical protein
MARRQHVGNATEFSKLEQGGRLLLSVAMLGLTAACGGDQPLAPTAGPVAGPTAGGAAVTRSGVELLVLVDEAGQARRVLIVRDERDPRVRAVERLGFRTLTSEALAAGGVDASTRAMFAAGEAKGLRVTYRRASATWPSARMSELGAMEIPPTAWHASVSSATLGARNLHEQLAAIETALGNAEDLTNLAIRAACGSVEDNRSEAMPVSVAMAHRFIGADCRAEGRSLLIESAEFILAAGAMIAGLESCGATLGATCLLVPPLQVMYFKEAKEMSDAYDALRKCLST